MAARRRRVVWSEQARRQVDETLAYISRDSLQAARSVLQETLSAAASLDTLAERGRVVPEVGAPEIREVFIHSYRLMYEVSESEVVVLAFLHGARDFERWRKGS